MPIGIRGWAVLAAAVAVLAGCAESRTQHVPAAAGTAVDTSGAIPWIAAPTTPPPAPTPPPPAPRPQDARPCGATDVRTTLDGDNGAGGHLITYLRFRNVSDAPCLLAGYPHITATGPGLPPVTATDGSFFPTDGTADMAPGAATLLGVETDTYCAARPGGGGAGPLYRHLTVALPGGGSVDVDMDAARGLDVTCGLHSTGFFVPLPPQPEPRTAADVLTASLELPSQVQAGGTLVYVVDLADPTDQDVPLTPCPVYVQSAPPPATVKDIEALDCAVDAIGAHRSVRFEMHLHLPGDTPPGALRISWSLAGPGDGAHADGFVTVVPAPSGSPPGN